jgi:hypothetical protein
LTDPAMFAGLGPTLMNPGKEVRFPRGRRVPAMGPGTNVPNLAPLTQAME